MSKKELINALNVIHMMRENHFDKAKMPTYNNNIDLICNVCVCY